MSHEESATTPETAPGGPDADRVLALERACEHGLREHLPGLEIVDRRLELMSGEDGTRRVDLLGVDGSGRAVLIVFSDGASDDNLLVALESVAFARHHADLLARHVQSLRGDAPVALRRPPLSVLVAESFAPRLLDKLALLPARELALYEVIEVKSGSRSSVGFRPVESARAPSRSARTTEQFIAALPPEMRACAEILVRRLPRLDERLTCTSSEDSLVWRVDERDLCRLDRVPEGLVASDATAPEPIPMRDPRDVGELLDRVIRASRGLPEKPAIGLERAHTQLLTPDEIAAFRDP
jgi:hypothetical protein